MINATRRLSFTIQVLLVLAATVLAGCQPAAPAQTPADRIVYGLTLSPSGFDPHRHQSSELGIVLRQVYDTLVYRDPATKAFVPGLASEWTISDDGLTYTFRLRQDVIFHDGTPFNAQAVAANLDRIRAPETQSQAALPLLGPLSSYEVVDNFTIELRLAEPYSPLLDSFSQVYLGMASPAALAEYPLERYQFHQVGTGPYRWVEYVPDTRVVIARNPDYAWGPAFTATGDTTGEPVAAIEYRFYTDPPTRIVALEEGTAQIMGELPPTDARNLTGSAQIRIIRAGIPGQPQQFLLNTRRYPTDNVVFRQALLYGTNRAAIADLVFQGFSPAAYGPLARVTQFYSAQVESLYPYDVAQARALLESIGLRDADGSGYLDDGGGGNLQVSVIVPPWSSTPAVAQLLQDQWRALGIEAALIPVPDFPTLRDAVNGGAFNLVAFNTSGLDPAFLSTYYATGGSRNWIGYSNPQLDAMLREALWAQDPEVRRVQYALAQALIMQEALVLPIRDVMNLNGADARIDGLIFDAYGWFPIMANARQSAS